MKHKSKWGTYAPAYRHFTPPPPKPKNKDCIIRGHRMIDIEAEEMLWREIDQAFECGEKLFKEYLEQATNEIIKKFKEKENDT